MKDPNKDWTDPENLDDESLLEFLDDPGTRSVVMYTYNDGANVHDDILKSAADRMRFLISENERLENERREGHGRKGR